MKPTYIGRLYLENYKCFKEKQELSFLDEEGKLYQWTIILGNNNTGKTNVLKAIASMEPLSDHKHLIASIIDNEVVLIDIVVSDSHEIDFLNSVFIKVDKEKYVSELGTLKYIWVTSDDLNLRINSYGVFRRNTKKSIAANIEENNSISLFNSEVSLINIEDWLSQIFFATKIAEEPSTKVKAEKRYKLIKEVIISEVFPEIEDVKFETDEDLSNHLLFKVKEGWYQLENLGYGYQSAMSWIIDLSKKMIERYPDSPNPLKEPAVVLVDEIDMHLHPSWQKRIVRYLSEHFTATQFIVTTHSPMILQALERVNLYILRKNGVGVNIEPFATDNFQGWELSEIVGELMETPTQSDLYKDLLNKFNEGLQEDNYEKAKKAYDALIEILHPDSAKHKLLSIQLSQVAPENDKA